MTPLNLLQAKQCKSPFQIQQFIAEYCFKRDIKVSFIHDDCQVEEQYYEEIGKAVEEFIKS